MTQDGEVATYTSQVVGNLTKDGRVLSVGVNFWSTPSAGELAFMNDIMNVFKFQVDQSGNFSAMGWEWKYMYDREWSSCNSGCLVAKTYSFITPSISSCWHLMS